MKRGLCLTLAALALLLCTACGGNERLDALEAQVSSLEDALSQSEAQRVSDAYDFQRQLEALTAVGVQAPPPERHSGFGVALRAGEVHSVLIIGDSISDGNGDGGSYAEQSKRAELGGRLVLEAAGERYYEKPQDQQDWVKHFRGYLLENTSVTVVHNAAINGKSAKWFNAHKEQLFTDDHPRYDAIFVMLGTNDRRDCLNEKEFYTEYSQLLSYLQEKCTYLTVMTPLPTFPEENSTKNMENRQIADTVLQLCENNGYTCLNLYRGMIDYARNEGRALDEYFYAGCHPNSGGYLALWRLIADELGLNLPVEDVYARDEVLPQVIDIGMDRPEITEQTNLADTYQGAPVFPEGVSLYAVSQPFKSDISFGGTIVTRKYSNGAGYQIFKPFYLSYNFIRRANVDGVFGPWSVTNREQYSGEDW